MKTPGILFFPNDDHLLVELIVVDEEFRSNWYEVTEIEVMQACAQYNLPYEKVMDLILNKNPDVHTLFINAPVYLESLKE